MTKKRIFLGSFINDESLKKSYPIIKKEFGGLVKGRWVPFENFHITYKFLGNIDIYQIEYIRSSLKKYLNINLECDLEFKGFGAFPNLNNPKVFFLKLNDKTGILEEIHSFVEEQLALIGFKKDTKKFIPHITVKRPKYVDSKTFIQKIKQFENTVFGHQNSIELNIVESKLLPEGAKYFKI